MSPWGRGLRWAAVALYAATIFVLSSIPHVHVPLRIPYGDKILHAILYAGFALFLLGAVRATWPDASRWKTALFVVLAAGLYGVSDEFHQRFVPGRFSEVGDVAADAAGAFVAAFGATVLRRRRAPSTGGSAPSGGGR